MNPNGVEQPSRLKGVVGIQNMGNTCYANTVLQLLRTCQKWNLHCLTHEMDPTKKIIAAYKDMLATMWSAYKPAYVRPLAFMADIRAAVQNTVYDMFAMPIQNDAQEYLGYLLDKFHEELKVQVDVPDVVPQDMAGMANRAWEKFLSKNTSVVVETFFGMMRKMVICSNCSTRTYQWELFNMLKIPCYGGATLHDWIEKEVNEVTDIDAFKCNTCNAKHPAKKYSHLWKLPQHLFIVLDRFQPNGMKAINVCPIMERLSFPQYFAEEAQNLGLHQNGYQLCGIADHHGGQIHGGHYTAQFKHPITGEWWFFDDERAHEMHAPQFSSSAYILSYRMD